jgi:uncharacterized glyoxalase superfamily protein PhnB
MNIPPQHQTVMPYLMVADAEKLLVFLQTVFNAQETYKALQPDGQSIMHAEVNIGGSTIMFANTTDQWKAEPANLFIYVPDADATFKTALEAGATSVMELADKDYGRSGGVQDPFGNVWWITSV